MIRPFFSLSPLPELREWDELFDRFFMNMPGPTATRARNAMMPVDIYEKGGVFYVKASVPGIAPEDLDVSIDNNVLTIRGETKFESETEEARVFRREVGYGSFTRSIKLPEGLDLDKVDAHFENGLVTISIPKIAEQKAPALKVKVKTGERKSERPALKQ